MLYILKIIEYHSKEIYKGIIQKALKRMRAFLFFN